MGLKETLVEKIVVPSVSAGGFAITPIIKES